MTSGLKQLRAFVGFQTASEFHSFEQIQGVAEAVVERLKDDYSVAMPVKYGMFPAGTILWNEVRDSISSSDVVILDISENNPNVMIEVGLGYGFGKLVILLKSTASEATYKKPSDLAAVYVPYAPGELQSQKTVEEILAGIANYLRETHEPDFYFKSLWGFGDYDDVLVVCSELDEPEKRQRPEANEYIYLSKYGDVDALVEVLVTLHRLYPRLNVQFRSSGEVSALRQDYSGNLILIGGPDYNQVAGLFEEYCPFEYTVGEKEEDIYLKHKVTGDLHTPTIVGASGEEQILDYGFFMKRRNPHNSAKRLFAVGGTHTYGVFGAIKAFSYWGSAKDVAYENCRAIVDSLGNDPDFCVLFEVRGARSDVQTPAVDLSRAEAIG